MGDDQDSIFASYQDRFRPKAAARPPAPPQVTIPATTTFNASHSRTQLMLDFRGRDGDHFALAYSFLVAVAFDRSAITLEFSGYRVTLRGVRLDDVFRGIVAHQVGSVQEVDEVAHKLSGDVNEPAVYSIRKEKV